MTSRGASVRLGFLSVTSVLAAVSPAAGQTATLSAIMKPQNGSQLTAAFGAASGMLQETINQRLINVQPAELRIAWPVQRVADVAPFYEQNEADRARIQTTIVVANPDFRSKQAGIRALVADASGSMKADLTAALRSGQIDATTAARVLFNRQSVLQLLAAGGARVRFTIAYSAGEPVGEEVKSEDVEWVFRFYRPQGAEQVPTALLAAVDVVVKPRRVGLLRSDGAVGHLKQVEATAEFLMTQELQQVPVQSAPPIADPSGTMGGGPDKPLLVDFVEEGFAGLEDAIAQAEAGGKVSVGLALGIVHSAKQGTLDVNQDAFSGINVGLEHKNADVWAFGVLAGLGTRRDLFIGPSFTLGRVLTLGGGFRGVESNDQIRATVGFVVALNAQQLLGRRDQTPKPLNVLANSKTLAPVSPDAHILQARLSGIIVEVVNQSQTAIDPTRVNLQPRLGTGGTVSLSAFRNGIDLSFPVLAGTYGVEVRVVGSTGLTCSGDVVVAADSFRKITLVIDQSPTPNTCVVQ